MPPQTMPALPDRLMAVDSIRARKPDDVGALPRNKVTFPFRSKMTGCRWGHFDFRQTGALRRKIRPSAASYVIIRLPAAKRHGGLPASS